MKAPMRIVKNSIRPLDMNTTDNPAYDPNALLDYVLKKYELKNDAELSRALEVMPPVVSKIRHGRQPISANILLRIHDFTQEPMDTLRVVLGVPTYR